MGACAPALCTRRCRIWELGARGFQLGGRVVWPWPTPVRVGADIPHLGFLGPHPDPVDLQSAVIDRVRPLIAVAKVMTIFEMRVRSSFAAVFGAMTFMYFLFSSCRGFSRSASPPARHFDLKQSLSMGRQSAGHAPRVSRAAGGSWGICGGLWSSPQPLICSETQKAERFRGTVSPLVA
jgi:hypothetical protein